MNDKIRRKINDYKENLYSRKYKDTTKEDLEKLKRLKKKAIEVDGDWDDVELELEKQANLYKLREQKTNIYAVLLIISLSFFIIAAATAAFFLYFQKNESPLNQIKISVLAKNQVDSGEVFNYSIKIENNTEYKFKNLSLYIKYPKGAVDAEEYYKKETEEIELKDLLPGGIETIKKQIILSGAPKETKKISFNLDYQVDGYSSLLQSKKEFMVKITSAPVFAKVEIPKYVKANKEFDFKIIINSNSNKDQKDLILVGRYPNGFEVVSTEPNPIVSTQHKNIFRIKKLETAKSVEIKLKGKLSGQNGEMKVLSFLLGSGNPENNEVQIKYFDSKEKIFIKKPGLDLRLFCNGQEADDDVIISGGKVKCFIKLTNNLTTKITNIKIKLNYNDDLIQESDIEAHHAYVDSNNNQIYWDKNTYEELTVLDTNSWVQLPLIFILKRINDLAGNFRNPKISLDFELIGTNFDEKNELGVVKRQVQKNILVNSYVNLLTNASYKNGPFTNIGGPTGKVGEKITYTINWAISNSTNKLTNVVVTGKIPVGVNWEDQYIPEDAYVKYNPETRIVKWSLKSLPPFIGYRTPPRKLSIQLSTIPVLDDVGGFMTLMTDVKLRAIDSYTKEVVETKPVIINSHYLESEYPVYNTGEIIRN